MKSGYHIHSVGKWRSSPEKELFEQYKKRLKHPISLHQYSNNDALIEGLPIQERKTGSDYIIICDETGDTVSSKQFSKIISKARNMGRSSIHLVIGAAEGLPKSMLSDGDSVIALGRMTWPHMMVRAMLSEQIYRAEAIITGHPYHK